MEPGSTYENLVIRAVVTNDNDLWIEAHAWSVLQRFSTDQIHQCHDNVERWLRLHGVTPMKSTERKALLCIQSVIRRWIVLRSLIRQYTMYTRLAQMDSLDHCKHAMALESVLTRAWGHIHGR